ncbi:GNAT family N-acetyltransferase [Streptomyces sp. BI20]|uniref:GNAT family N-acetyltransferase n=1 Tax=Streptomyces sp. BI20 TaxID=3403460 RepID=UPI003C76950F
MTQDRLDGPAVRAATHADIPELVRLRGVALAALGVDPGPADAPWRAAAAEWFAVRIGHRADWACRVVGGAPGEPLLATGAAWLTHHLPHPGRLDGVRGYLDAIVTDEPARGRGHGARIVTELVAWLAGLGVELVQLHASADGEPVYRRLGFEDARFPAMDLFLSPAAPAAGSSPGNRA